MAAYPLTAIKGVLPLYGRIHRLAIALLILTALHPVWASAALLDPVIELSPQTGLAGTKVEVNGSGFDLASVVTITFDGGNVDTDPNTVMTDPLGNFEAQFTVPYSAEKGTYIVNARSHGVTQAEAESSFEVTTPNMRPVADSQSVTVQAGESVQIILRGSDPDGDSITFYIVGEPQHGRVENFDPNSGSLTYVPASEFYGRDRLTFRVNDGKEDSALGEVSIKVEQSASGVTMRDMRVEVEEDTETAIYLTAAGADSSSLTFEIVDLPAHGSLGPIRPYDRNSGYVTYTPMPNFNGADFFTAMARDSRSESEIATVSIDVLPVQDVPIALGAEFETLQDVSIPVTLMASDPDGDTLSYILVTIPDHGTLTGTAPSLSYLPGSDYYGWDTFSFKVNDGTADSNVAGIQILIKQSTSADDGNYDSGRTGGDSAPNGGPTGNEDLPDTEPISEPGPPDSLDDGSDTAEPTGTDDEGTGSVDFPSSPADSTPPRIIVPASPLLYESGSESGTDVTYAIAAIDDVDGEVMPECSPASGYTFPVGRVNVVCRATDSSGNIAVESFVVEVKLVRDSDSSFGIGQFRVSDYSQPILASVILALAGIAVFVGLRLRRASLKNAPQQTATGS